jgi:hypothetical protein
MKIVYKNHTRKMRLQFAPGFVLIALLSSSLQAQNRTTDTTAKQGTQSQRATAGPRPYSEVITARAKTDDGLFKVHRIEDTYLLEIPDSLLGADVLVVNRLAKAAAEVRASMTGYAGDQIGEQVVRFEKGPGNRIFLRSISFKEMSKDSSSNGLYRSVLNSNVQPIVAVFDIKAYSKDSIKRTSGFVIDLTSFLNSDNDVLYFDPSVKKTFSLGGQQSDRSFVESVQAFPNNIEIKAVKTFLRTASGQGPQAGPSGPVTYELNSSMILLPRKPMQPRYFDPRVGYFATGYTDFDINPHGVKKISMITRWKLEPKPEDVSKYLRGELVEPAKPIVIYIDPATPKKWVPYLMQGVNDWNVAFEQAGWKNAVVAREAPLNDPNWSLEGAGYSAIVYKPSDIANASGPHVHDPRTGEILETHINWFHNVMDLLHNWYFIQAAAVDPKARSAHFDDALMGQLIRFVSSHEVGHTLGLRHNFGSSSTVPVDKLRDKAWIKANGHTPSIMDYARFNYVAQPEDSIGQDGLFPRIGAYDKWAIEWGYRWFPEYKTPEEERVKLNQWIIEKMAGNKHLWFGTESDPNDPRCQNEDLGDNAMKAGAYGIKNLKRILPNLLQWTTEKNEDFGSVRIMYKELTDQLGRYMGHVSKNIGGVMKTPRMVEEKGNVYQFVNKTTQKEAMQFLQQQLFTTPTWLLDKKLFSVAGAGDMNTIIGLQQSVLNRLISDNTLGKLLQFEAFDAANAYTAVQMLNDLKSGIWTELSTKTSIDIYRRNLQKLYVERLITLIRPGQSQAMPATAPMNKATDALSILKGHVKNLAMQVKLAQARMIDASSKLHLQDVYDRLSDALTYKANGEQ